MIVYFSLSFLTSFSFFNFASVYQDVAKEYENIQENFIYIINVQDDLMELISEEKVVAKYKIIVEKIGGVDREVFLLSKSSLYYGIPIYQSEVRFITIKKPEEIKSNVYYSNLSILGATKLDSLIFPKEHFIKNYLPNEILFKVVDDDFFKFGFMTIMKFDQKFVSYAKSKNRYNNFNSGFAGDGDFLKNNSLDRLKLFFNLYGVISFIPFLFSIIAIYNALKFQLEQRVEEIMIRKIYFESKKKLFRKLFFEFLQSYFLLVALSTLISFILSRSNQSIEIFIVGLTAVILLFFFVSFISIHTSIRYLFKSNNIYTLKGVIYDQTK